MDTSQTSVEMTEAQELGSESHNHVNYPGRETLQQLPSQRHASLDMGESRKKVRRRGRRSTIHGTLRRTAAARMRRENADDVTAELVNDLANEANDDDGDEDMQTATAVRQLNVSLTKKLEILRKVNREREEQRKDKNISIWIQAKAAMAIRWKHMQDAFSEMQYSLELWRGYLKRVEGVFGSGVLSYFEFLRWIFILNIVVFFFIASFLVTPMVIYRVFISKDNFAENAHFTGLEMLTGDGWFEQTELYYGYYTFATFDIAGATSNNGNNNDGRLARNDTAPTLLPVTATTANTTTASAIELNYNMKWAYLFTFAAVYALCFLVLAISVARSYGENYVEAGDDVRIVYVSKVLSGWDYGISEGSAAKYRHRSIYNDLREYLASARRNESQTTCFEQFTKYGWWMSINVFVALLMALAALALYVVHQFQRQLIERFLNETEQAVPDVDDGIAAAVSHNLIESELSLRLSGMVLPVYVAIVNLFLPYLFAYLVEKEGYRQPRTELNVTMIRIMSLKLLMLGMAVVFWLRESECGKEGGPERCVTTCWETNLAENIYRLLVVDLIVGLLSSFFAEYCRRAMCGRKGEFNIGRNSLELIYTQTLCWVGMFYSPLLPLIVLIKLFVEFHFNRVSVMANCSPTNKPWRASSSHAIFLLFLGVAYIGCMIAVGYAIIRLSPSATCGPYTEHAVVYDVVIELLDEWEQEIADLRTVFLFLKSPGVIVFLLGCMCVGVYYFHVLATGAKEMVQLLREQLILEGQDRLFLSSLFLEASQAHNAAAASAPASAPATAAAAPAPTSNDNGSDADDNMH